MDKGSGGPVRMGELYIYPTASDLPAALRPHLRPVMEGLEVFHHPLCIQLMPVSAPCPIEDLIADRQAAADEALRTDGVAAYIWRLEKPYRLEALLDFVNEGAFTPDPEAYWQLLAQVWVDSEIEERARVWGALINVDLPGKDLMTRASDRAALMELGPHITVYRGVQAADQDGALEATFCGYSWSLSRDVAVKFSRRLRAEGDLGWVASAEVPVDLVQAYLTRRGEEEIILRPEDLDDMRIAISHVDDAPEHGCETDLIPLSDLEGGYGP